MSGTSVIQIPAGTVSTPFVVTPQQTLCVGTQVLGGTTNLETAPSPAGPFTTFASNQGASYSFRPSLGLNQYVRVTAIGQVANALLTDLGQVNTPLVSEMIIAGVVFAAPNSTSEQILYSFRVPPLYLPLNWRMEIGVNAVVTNSAGTKQFQVRANGIGGTLMGQQAAISTVANANFLFAMQSLGDGVTIKGFGIGSSFGLGTSASAYTTLVRDYINQETEFVLTVTKSAGADNAEIDGLVVRLLV